MPADISRVIFGWPLHHGGVLHAVIDEGQDPAGQQPWLRRTRPLCSTSDTATVMRVTPEHEFSPEGLAFVGGRVCGKCTPVWSALYTEPIPGFDRECRTCQQQKPINEFRTDNRTTDRISNVCETCRADTTRQRRPVTSSQRASAVTTRS